MMKTIYLNLGDWYFGSGNIHIKTLLGSCVAITLWEPTSGYGGMCHIKLPSRPEGEKMPLDGTYADEAITLFMNALNKKKLKPEAFIVGIYGGGQMFKYDPPQVRVSIGENNITAVKKLLKLQHFTINKESTGGAIHRHITLDLSNGDIQLKESTVQQTVLHK